MPEYGDHEYWEKRYSNLTSPIFDWLLSFDKLKEILTKDISFGDRILILGCGNSGSFNSTK